MGTQCLCWRRFIWGQRSLVPCRRNFEIVHLWLSYIVYGFDAAVRFTGLPQRDQPVRVESSKEASHEDILTACEGF
jgi:hypothetical protein